MNTKQVNDTVKIVTWIIFIGLCIETGAKITSFIVSFFFNPEGTRNFYMGMDLSALYDFSKWHYVTMAVLLIAYPAMKAYLFFLIIKVTTRLDIMKPFSEYNADLILKMSYASLQIGILSAITNIYADWLVESMVKFPYERRATEFLFMAAILFVIAHVFKRGIALQKENDLTI
ncbi:MAG TPA: DUF2975 domain-containing protein [Bacteroidales bacterium]|nr:DUF2975 domain-containing protein [Bacteroidales bacterium]